MIQKMNIFSKNLSPKNDFLPEMPPNKMTEYWAGIFRAVVSDP